MQAAVQPGSIDSEAGIFAMTFDLSNTRLITAEADKTIKIYKEDESAVKYFFFSCSVKLELSVRDYFLHMSNWRAKTSAK